MLLKVICQLNHKPIHFISGNMCIWNFLFVFKEVTLEVCPNILETPCAWCRVVGRLEGSWKEEILAKLQATTKTRSQKGLR
jgi:hypothetical protein